MAEEINIPSLIVVLVISGFVVKHFFFRRSSSDAQAGTRAGTQAGARAGARAGTRAGESGSGSHGAANYDAINRRFEIAIERVQAVIPTADRREVWWDLRRNGIVPAETIERLLSGGLDTPPVTFQTPPAPAPGAIAAETAALIARLRTEASTTPSKPSPPSLIQRYGLEAQLEAQLQKQKEQEQANDGAAGTTGTTGTAGTAGTAGTTGTTGRASRAKPSRTTGRTDRQSIHQKRRDEMILKAHIRMLAKMKEA